MVSTTTTTTTTTTHTVVTGIVRVGVNLLILIESLNEGFGDGLEAIFRPGDDLVGVAVGVYGPGRDCHSQSLALVASAAPPHVRAFMIVPLLLPENFSR